jgi:hypothetical protein
MMAPQYRVASGIGEHGAASTALLVTTSHGTLYHWRRAGEWPSLTAGSVRCR